MEWPFHLLRRIAFIFPRAFSLDTLGIKCCFNKCIYKASYIQITQQWGYCCSWFICMWFLMRWPFSVELAGHSSIAAWISINGGVLSLDVALGNKWRFFPEISWRLKCEKLISTFLCKNVIFSMRTVSHEYHDLRNRNNRKQQSKGNFPE